MSLEEYLENQYHRDVEDISTIEEVLRENATLFESAFDPAQFCWPYELRAGAVAVVGKNSQGTSAMILAAIGKMVGRCTHRDGLTPQPLSEMSPKLVECFESGLSHLAKTLETSNEIKSGTFGRFDPLTISHLAELKRGVKAPAGTPNAIATALNVLSRAEAKITELAQGGLTSGNSFVEPGDDDPHWCTDNAFLILRISRAFVDLTNRKPSNYKGFFETRLHEQLSFSSIPDSRFDPAELAFCLEGLLICARESVDPVLFNRVFSVLGREQETSAYWRPNRPFIADPTGRIILPLSVEGANSLLRSVEIVDGDKLHGTFSAAALPMFRRFWQWLRARKVEIAALGKQCIGWHSEHINEAGVIHLWDTSQVMEFLIGFRKLLRRHIACETLVRSRVAFDEPPQQAPEWTTVVEKYEPLSATSAIAPRVFDLIKDDFVDPWRNRSPMNYSILLYGPPGTGKTTVARSIAKALKFRLITVTVSDFLGAGGAMVEARAKAIFQMLGAQSDCVILFDEVDAFLLDRDSRHYRAQDTLFQFLTPGMLTKINDLREAKRSIFIIATNYANRIDPAIKRPGRIDKQYLLLPPDLSKREKIIVKEFEDLKLSAPAEITAMAKESVYLGYSEIIGALQGRLRKAPSEMIEALRSAARSSSDELYLARVRRETTFPEEEFLATVQLATEFDRQNEVKDHIEALDGKHRTRWDALLKRSPKFAAELRGLGVLS